MRSFITALAAVATATLAAAQLRIETPTNLVVCQPALLTWAGGEQPYYVSVIPGGQPSAASLKDFPQTSSTQQTWNVDLPAGQEVSLRITDATGTINYSEKVTIREGSNTNCLNGAAASGGSASAASGASSAASSGAAASVSSASGAATSATSSAGGAVSSASSRAAGATGAAGSSISSVTGARTSGSPSGTTAGANASASSTTNAASLGAKVQTAGIFGAVAAIFGVALF